MNILLFIFYSILILILIHLISLGYISYRRSRTPPVTLINNRDKMESIQYSEKILEFTKNIIKEISIIRFKEFVDHIDTSKVAKSHYENMASEVAKEVYTKINMNNILFQYTLFTKEYFEELIIDYSIEINKSLVLNYYNNIGGNK